MSVEKIDYHPGPIAAAFVKDYLPGKVFESYIVGPFGSAKTTALFMKLAYMARLQEPSPDGIRRTRAVIVRNSAPMLRDTTLKSWFYWFKPGQAGDWRATDRIFLLKIGDIECEVLFRALDTPDDVDKVMSLEVTFVVFDEFVQINKKIVEAIAGRCGRYPNTRACGVEATNYGIWGASNPDTEDSWWYGYLHGLLCEKVVPPEGPKTERTVHYFEQPSGLHDDAENLENLPGGRGYYENLASKNPENWVNQFVHAKWGYTADGKPVVQTFRPEYHLSHKPLVFNPNLPLVLGIDPGLGGSAIVIGQEDMNGCLRVLGELVQSGMAADRIINERLKPYLARRFPGADLILSPDPASENGNSANGISPASVFRRAFPGCVKTETNNRLPLRLDAIDHYAGRLTGAGPALIIDATECPSLVRALRGGWRFEMTVSNGELKPIPEKNNSSHVGDAFGYLCRYFHRQFERGYQRGQTVYGRRQSLPVSQGTSYNQGWR